MSKLAGFELCRALPSDAEDIAVAHFDSICSIGPAYYPPEVIAAWAADLTRDLYVNAMADGEVFFIAVGEVAGKKAVLGFASDYVIEGTRHGASVYVRGAAARRGIGSALLRLAETEAISRGAESIHVEASLAGVEFYKANGFKEITRGETQLRSGVPIRCVFMEKTLVQGTSHSGTPDNKPS